MVASVPEIFLSELRNSGRGFSGRGGLFLQLLDRGELSEGDARGGHMGDNAAVVWGLR